ncbi:MAG: hypothetical protein AAGC57_10155 [Pseudomonadota bacterium]
MIFGLRISLSVTASVAVHLGLAALLLVATQPEQVPPPERIEARLRMQAANVRETRADQKDPDTDRAPEAEGASEAVGSATVRSERAGALSADRVSTRPAAQSPQGGRMGALSATGVAARPTAQRPRANAAKSVDQVGEKARTARPDIANAKQVERTDQRAEPAKPLLAEAKAISKTAAPLAARAASAPKTEAIAPPGARVTAAAAQAPRLAAGAQPEAERLALARPKAPAILSDAPEAEQATAVLAAAAALPTATPATPRIAPAESRAAKATELLAPVRAASEQDAKGEPPIGLAAASLAGQPPNRDPAEIAVVASAGLAWSGGAETSFDAVSLATVQAFMAPKQTQDSDLHGGDVRDGLAALLADYPCARMEAAFVPETGALEVRGHVPAEALRDVVETQLRERIGGAIGVGNDLLVLPQPLCGVLDGVEALGLPQSTDQTDDPLVIGQAAQAKIERFSDGDPFGLNLGGADYDAFVYVDYFDRAGNVIHLIPNEHVTLRRQEADSLLRIGIGNPEFDPLGMRISAPFGRDIVVAFAASKPVYEGLRPIIEPAGPYLDWLRDRIADSREATDFKGEWVYLFVDTSAR